MSIKRSVLLFAALLPVWAIAQKPSSITGDVKPVALDKGGLRWQFVGEALRNS